MRIRAGQFVRHISGQVGRAAADETSYKVLVEVNGRLRTWSKFAIADPPPPEADPEADTVTE